METLITLYRIDCLILFSIICILGISLRHAREEYTEYRAKMDPEFRKTKRYKRYVKIRKMLSIFTFTD